MKIIIDTKKIERNRKIGQFSSLSALVILFGGFAIAISQIITQFQDKSATPVVNEQMLTYSYVAMFVGLILTQVSLYFGNRWGRKPSIDESISQALKGLDDRYILYHYKAPVPHLLLGPSGIWVLSPMYHAGTITYEKNRYKQQGISFINRFFGQEGLGRPDQEARIYVEDMQKFIRKNLNEDELPKINTVIVFTNPKTVVQVVDPPLPTLPVDKLKDFIRRRAKEQAVTVEKLRPLIEELPES